MRLTRNKHPEGNAYENSHLDAAAENADNQAPLYRVSGSGDFHSSCRFDSDLPIKATNGITPVSVRNLAPMM